MEYFIIYSDMACTRIEKAKTIEELKEKLKKIQKDKNNFIDLVLHGINLTKTEL